MISVIIPVFNEEKEIIQCLSSLLHQKGVIFEIIVVDDGSGDNSLKILDQFQTKHCLKNFLILSQKHLGPATARNYGAKKAKGEILVFADADMTFAPDFLKKLILPIEKGKTKGTFTKEEFVSNWSNVWARCGNFCGNLSDEKRIPKDYLAESPVFRAILKSEFEKIHGFDAIGFTDDWTLSRKLKYKATAAEEAVCYHENPDSLTEVYHHARWIGKNEFLSGNFLRIILNLLRFNLFFQFFVGIFKAVKYKEIYYPFFHLVYCSAINVSLLKALFGENKNK